MFKDLDLTVSSSPHARDNATTRRLMRDVCIAMIPAALASVWFFGLRALVLIVVSVASAILAELIYQKCTRQPVTVSDMSAVVTGTLLAFNLPANAPWWLAVVGSFLAIVLIKQFFGGIGQNFMNPALAARAILFVSWIAVMTHYPNATPGNFLVGFTKDAADTVSSATPLRASGSYSLWDLFIGSVPGVLGETSKLALLLGGAYMLVRKVIGWHIPVAFIGTVFVCYLIKDGASEALYQILSGSLFLGAFFMATDYATSPLRNVGRIIMGIGCGLILFVIRAVKVYPEGCSFAILFMNVATPLIDKLTFPKSFGEAKQHG